MKFTHTIEEDIYSQINAGFTKAEIKENLKLKGTSEVEIEEAFTRVNFEQVVASSSSNNEGMSVKSILIGVVIVVIVLFKIARLAEGGGNIFMVLSTIIAVIWAIFYFARRR